jgi:hypothetical protein
VSITVPDTLGPRLVAAMRATFPDYEALSNVDAFRKVTGDFWRTTLLQYEERIAREQAAATVAAAAAAAVADGDTIV